MRNKKTKEPKLAHPIMKHFGVWKDVDIDLIIKKIYSTRGKSRRKPPTW